MQKDVKFSLIFAAVVGALVAADRYVGKPTENSSIVAVDAAVEKAASDAEVKLDLPGMEDVTKKATAAPAEKKKEDLANTKAGQALAKLFPKDLRKNTKAELKKEEPAPDLSFPDDLSLPGMDEKKEAPKSPSAKKQASPVQEAADSLAKTNSKSADGDSTLKESGLTLPDGDNWLNLPGVGSKDSKKKSTNDVLAVAEPPKRLPDPDPNPPKIDPKPVHPYFERFLREGSYYVREGDSLESIAYNIYGDAAAAKNIRAANESLLKGSEELSPGIRLKLPK